MALEYKDFVFVTFMNKNKNFVVFCLSANLTRNHKNRAEHAWNEMKKFKKKKIERLLDVNLIVIYVMWMKIDQSTKFLYNNNENIFEFNLLQKQKKRSF